MLIAGEDDAALLAAEDAAIAEAERRVLDPDPIVAGTIEAAPDTPLAELIGILRDDHTAKDEG